MNNKESLRVQNNQKYETTNKTNLIYLCTDIYMNI